MRLGLHFTLVILRSVFLVTFLFFCLVALIEVVEIGNRSDLSLFSDPFTTLGSAAVTSMMWALDLLPISLLVGAVLALMELQNSRALVVAKSAGVSIWGIARMPALVCALLGLSVTYALEPFALWANKELESRVGILDHDRFVETSKPKWLLQSNDEGQFFVRAAAVSESGLKMRDLTVFRYDFERGLSTRIAAASAQFTNQGWQLSDGSMISSDGQRQIFGSMTIKSESTQEALSLQLGSVSQMDIYTLQQYLSKDHQSDVNSARATNRLRQMEVLPVLLVGALLIAFAFTTGYSRHGTSGTQVLYGIVLGFVLYVITKLLDRAGEAGSMDASLAAWGPAIVTIVIGTSVLLWKEDG